MGLFGSLFGRKPEAAAPSHALIVHFKMSEADGTMEERADLFELEDRVINAVEKGGAGEYDGNEIGEGEYVLFMYGKSADRLWNSVHPLLRGRKFPQGSFAVKRYGEPGAAETRIELG